MTIRDVRLRLAVAVVILISCSSVANGQGTPTTGAPVVFNHKTLFRLYAQVGTFAPADRARIYSGRLAKLGSDRTFRAKAVTVVDAQTGSIILVGSTPLVNVMDDDARVVGVPRLALAEQYRRRIVTAVSQFRDERSTKHIVFAIVYTLLSTAGLFLALLGLRHALRRLQRILRAWHARHVDSLRFQSSELLSAERIVDALQSIARLIRSVIALALIDCYVVLVLGFFPWTQPYSQAVNNFVQAKLTSMWDSFLSALPNLFTFLLILVISYYILKFIHAAFREIERGVIVIQGFDQDWAEPTYKLVRLLVFALTAIAAFPYLPGSSSPAFQGISVFVGVLLSLGSTAAVANMVSGVVLTYMRPFRVGDRVKIGDTVGDVLDKSLLVIRVRTIKNVDVTIPNSLVLGSHIINYSTATREDGLILHTTVTIGYDTPWRQVHDLLVSAALATANVLETPSPFVLQTSLDDFYVSYQVNAYTNDAKSQALTYSHLHQNIQEKFNEAGVEIMSSHYSNLRDGNRTTIPQDHLPDGYEAPRFRINTQKEPGTVVERDEEHPG